MKRTILVVEDNALNLELVTDLLESRGHAVVQAHDGEQAIAAARRQEPDLILMDVSLPGIDGLQATRVLKQDPSTAGIPVVAVTAHAMRGDQQRVLEVGCCGYVSKPIDTRTFVDTVLSYLG